ncbi:hypothetical protein AVEN_161760-1 [Araneus ventricosus]|uniref:Uncharacterized protein n=1 Tax=Araneus ventricosus TaxID=182803 RepID=A0A4Y2LGN9_ARAVE|nr:hypothetical protein AVEN_161760-1 [Araneus ventricosus]
MYFHRFKSAPSPISSCGEIGTPWHYATSCMITLSWHMKPPAIQLRDQWFKVGRLVVEDISSGVCALSILWPFETDEVTLVVIGIGDSRWR